MKITLVCAGMFKTIVLRKALALAVSVHLAHSSRRELETWVTLRQIVGAYHLDKHTFTLEVVIQERVVKHAFPILTLNVFVGDRPDEQLSSYRHQQLDRCLREHDAQQKAAIGELAQIHPQVPVLPEGADSEYSTYPRLVDCYLGIEADRELIGAKPTEKVIKYKPWYTWIYKAVRLDQQKIRDVVDDRNFGIR